MGCVFALFIAHFDIDIRHQACRLFACVRCPKGQDTEASTTHDKPGSLTCPVYRIDIVQHFFGAETVGIFNRKIYLQVGKQGNKLMTNGSTVL